LDTTPGASSATKLELSGIAGSAGFAIGAAQVVDRLQVGVVRRRIAKHLADDEMERYDRAVSVASQGLREVAERAQHRAAEASILEAYVLMVEDETLREDVERRVRIDFQCTEWALASAVREMSEQLSGGDDPYLMERSHDIEFVGERILRALAGHQRPSTIPPSSEPTILIAHDLSPAETAGLNKERVLGMVTEMGTRTSHTAIIARALEIPAVVGVKNLMRQVGHGDRLIVDGVHGKVLVSPSDELLAEAQERSMRYYALASDLRAARDRPCTTKCGVPVTLKGNIELAMEASIALDHGARGIGLYRTEFLYVDRKDLPSEDEQYGMYKKVVEVVAPLPVTLRTFDIGGDKFASAFQVPPDMNPALGLRAVRLGLERPDVFKVQLRAMARASAHGDVRIMVPMVASLSELRAVRRLLDEALAEVDQKGQKRAKDLPLGAMVEVPSAAILADEFAREAEFLSIGTNDLVQYTLAVDRSSRELTELASYFDPAIIKLIKNVVEAGAFRHRPVLVCGAMASDPLAAILLVGMGLRELSMEATAIPEVKEAISRVTLEEAKDVAATAFEATTAREIEDGVVASLAPRIADLLDPDAA
jgi:phosphotransferase system enzyme I (PtsI)